MERKNERVGVAGHVGGIGVYDLVIISACCGEVLGDPGLCIGDTLTQNLIDSKGDVAHVLNNGSIVIEDRLSRTTAAGQAAENKRWQHKDEQYREHEQYGGSRKYLPCVLSRSQGQPCGGSIWPAYRRTFCGSGYGLAGFDGSVDSMGGTGCLGQAAFFLVVQFWIPPCLVCQFCFCYNVAGDNE